MCGDLKEGSHFGPPNATDLSIENSFDVQVTVHRDKFL